MEAVESHHVNLLDEPLISPESGLIFCPICSETFEEITFLIEHLRLHQSETEPQSKEETASKQANLDTDLGASLMISQPNSDEFTCEVCGKFYSSNKALRRHRLRHADRPFKCDVCESSFPVRSELLSHSNRHRLKRETRDSRKETATVDIDEISNVEESESEHTRGTSPSSLHPHSNRKLACQICGQNFGTKWSLNNHLTRHSGEKPFKCGVCKESFPLKIELNKHLKTHRLKEAGERRLQCEKCGKYYSSKLTFNRHLILHSGERPFKCDMCETSFPHRSELNLHLNKHRQNLPTHSDKISCPVCSKELKNKGCLAFHLRHHKKQEKGKEVTVDGNNQISDSREYSRSTETLICEVDPKIFALRENSTLPANSPEKPLEEFAQIGEKKILKADIQILNNERKSLEQYPSTTNTYSCAGCQKIFIGEAPKVCDSCHKEVPQRTNCRPNLKRQRDVSNRKGERQYSCQECGKSFTQEFHLKRHLPIHSNEIQHKHNPQTRLDESAQNSNVKKIIKTDSHISRTRKEKVLKEHPKTTNTFTCSNCKKIFFGGQPQSCDNCHIEFSLRPDVDVESLSIQYHSKENYICDVCGKNFNLKRKLTAHLQSHLKEKRFKCDVCEKSFLTPQGLNKHVKRHSSERSFSCENCGMSFSNKRDLTRHLTGISLASLIHLTNIKNKSKNFKIGLENILEKHNDTADLKETAIENQISNVEENALDTHAPTINTYTCKVCQKEFVGEKLSVCDKCKTELPEKSSLDVNIACQANKKASSDVCSDKSIFKCFFCCRAFSHINCLQVHVLCHSAENVTCGLCGGNFTHISTLYVHLRLHIGKKPYKCEQCDRSFVTKSHLETHLRAHSAEKPFLCEVCGKCFKYKITYDVHHRNHTKTKRLHTSKRPFECQICHERFFTNFRLMKHQCAASTSRSVREKCSCHICGKKLLKYSLKYHLLSHSREKEFKCEICGKLFTSKLYLNKHLPIHSEEKPFLCKICGDKFTTSKLLSAHRRKHSDAKPLECEMCHKRFFTNFYLKNHRCETPSFQKTRERCSCHVCGKEMSKTHLKKHLLLHSGEKPFKCEVCGRSFPCKLYLKKHLPIHSEEKPYPCEICEKKFATKKHLSDHRRHHSDKKYKKPAKHLTCEFCPKMFSSPSTLKEHLRTHSGEKPFTCDVCHRSFTQRGNLNSHRLHHEGVKAFLCEQCPKSFYTLGELNRHQQICNGQKPFECEFCHKTFRTSSYLCLHRRVHTGEKPFICKVCGKSFLGSTHLKRHMRIHTGERPYQCDVCQKEFTQKYNLKIHLRTHSREAPVPSSLPNPTRIHGAPTSSGLPDRTHDKDAASLPSLPNHSHGPETYMPSNLPNISDGRDASLFSVLPHGTLSVDAPMSSFLQSSTGCPDVHTSSGLPNHQMSGPTPVIQNWYY